MKKSNTLKKDGTDYKRLDAMTDEDIDFSEIPRITPEMFARGVARPPLKVTEPKMEVTLKLDRDLAKWYRTQGSGYQVLINFILRRFMQEELRKSARPKARRVS